MTSNDDLLKAAREMGMLEIVVVGKTPAETVADLMDDDVSEWTV